MLPSIESAEKLNFKLTHYPRNTRKGAKRGRGSLIPVFNIFDCFVCFVGEKSYPKSPLLLCAPPAAIAVIWFLVGCAGSCPECRPSAEYLATHYKFVQTKE